MRNSNQLAMVACFACLLPLSLAAGQQSWEQTLALGLGLQREGRYTEAEATLLNARRQAALLGAQDPRFFSSIPGAAAYS
jgi:hypothetical protein